MKRIFSILLIALLLLCPLAAAHADDTGYVVVPEGILSAEEEAALEARAAEIAEMRAVAVYFLFTDTDNGGSALIEETGRFLDATAEDDAVVLAVNPSLYYIQTKGAAAQTVFPDAVCDETLWEAFRSVKGDNAGKVRAYLDAADTLLASFDGVIATPDPQSDPAAQTQEQLSGADAILANVALTDGNRPTVVDMDELLTPDERAALSVRLKEIGTRQKCDVVVVTTPSLGSKTAEEYADDFFDYIGYGYGAVPDENGSTVNGDGILLLVCMENRDFAVSTSGYAITAFTDYGIQVYLEDAFLPYLSKEDFAAAFNAFADGCDALLTTARAGESMDVTTVSEKTAGGNPILVDHAGILNVAQIESLSKQLKSIGDQYRCDVILVTDVYYGDADTYAQNYYERVGYGYRDAGEDRGGILVFFSRGGELGIYRTGAAEKAFQGRGLYKFRQKLLDAMYSSDYNMETVVQTYADTAAQYLNKAANGRPYNPINWFPVLLAAGVGLLFAFIPVGSMKNKLVSVGKQTNAVDYLAPGSFQITQNSDVLLNTTVSKTVHVTQSSSGSGGGRSGGGFGGFHGGSSTHTSSSGGFHGGHSGKF